MYFKKYMRNKRSIALLTLISLVALVLLIYSTTDFLSSKSYSKEPDLVKLAKTELDENQKIRLVNEVRGIFAHNCYKCHGKAKQKGMLRLDEKEFVFEGGEDGVIIVAGNPGKSELLRRIKLPKDHKEAMPSKGKTLSEHEIALIELWIEKGAPWPDGASQQSAFPMARLEPRNPKLPPATTGLKNPIDLWVNAYFDLNKIDWKEAVDDPAYLRRIYMDIVGLQPSVQEMETFQNDIRVDKRERWVEKLLSQNDDYAQHWLTFWNDALRNDYTGTGYITGGRYNINFWLYSSLQKNKPYDVFAKELLYPDDSSKGFISGIKWRGTVNASQRVEMQAAQNVGQVLLGLNLKCASCHDSFISDWKLEDAYAFANIFSEESLEINRCEKPQGKFAGTRLLWPSLGQIDSSASRSEKLKQLADKLVQPANGRLYRTVVNRVWRQMMGRGIIEPVDEMDNMPWSADLLDWMAVNFTENGYDLKKLIYLIATSKTYQLPSVSLESPAQLIAENYVFKGMLTKRLTAEQFSDGVSEIITPIFEEKDLKFNPFRLAGYEPTGQQIPRASLVANNAFLTALGRPNREVVATSRDSQASLLQALELTNGEKLNAVLQKGAALWKTLYTTSDEIINEMYKRALFRKPNPKELEIARQVLGKNASTEQIADFFWVMVLHPEFQLIK